MSTGILWAVLCENAAFRAAAEKKRKKYFFHAADLSYLLKMW
jgi:hypothetical protein